MRRPRVAGEIFTEHGHFTKHGTKNMIACDSTLGVPANSPPEREKAHIIFMYLFIVFSFYIYPGEKLLQALRFCDELCVRREADMEDIPWVSDLSS